MKVSDLTSKPLETICIYGTPGSGKTTLAATIADVPHIKRVIYLDTENSTDSFRKFPKGLINPENLRKLDIYRFTDILGSDTKKASPGGFELAGLASEPRAAVSIMRWFQNPVVHYHPGKGEFLVVKTPDTEPVPGYTGVDTETAVVIDTASQLTQSIYGLTTLLYKSKDGGPMDGKNYWMHVGNILTSILTRIQNPRCTFIVVSHAIMEENEVDQVGMTYPLIGSKAYSLNVSKYFGHVVFTQALKGAFMAYSSNANSRNAAARSRLGVKLEIASKPSLAPFFSGGESPVLQTLNPKLSTAGETLQRVTR